jgi:hypothetical protein
MHVCIYACMDKCMYMKVCCLCVCVRVCVCACTRDAENHTNSMPKTLMRVIEIVP